MKYTILQSDWYTPPAQDDVPVIGIVAIATGPQKHQWKAYIGAGHGINKYEDEQYIAHSGAKVSKEIACAAFPGLRPDAFVY